MEMTREELIEVMARAVISEVEAWLASPELENTRYMECSGPGTFYPDRSAMLAKLRTQQKGPSDV